ncbi:MFS transporter [Kaistella faecalis]|uniref:MFS transporter n=1 Tax=Kaistella faecalis TaxID=2852098 RepID=UPI001E4A4C8C|nr:MFS transporter [Chryseobacterium faecale]UFK98661.1 MFS transporter [Chryseobacterium faecale]
MEVTFNKRWLIAIMGTLTHLGLGTVYAWSFFQKPIAETYGWTNSETAWTFSLAILMLGITAAWCGSRIERFGARKLAVSGVILYALGYIISSFALSSGSLFLLYFGFGIVGGIGLGLAYVTPVAVVLKYFPDKAGLVTGMVVMGFGLGALVMSKVLAPFFLETFNENLPQVFLFIGITLLSVLPFLAQFLRIEKSNADLQSSEKISVLPYVMKADYLIIWLVFSFNIIAGMIFISFQSPLLQDLLKSGGVFDMQTLEAKGATLIGISALFNGIGRFFWGSVSDKIGRIVTFRLILLIQIFVFIMLINTSDVMLFSAGVCIILLCYGGGFGVIPSLIKERYGSALAASIYGITLIGWGIGGIFGPQITAFMIDHFPENAGNYAYFVGLVLLSSGLGLLFLINTKNASQDVRHKKKSLKYK